jgi:hypothetical protein
LITGPPNETQSRKLADATLPSSALAAIVSASTAPMNARISAEAVDDVIVMRFRRKATEPMASP